MVRSISLIALALLAAAALHHALGRLARRAPLWLAAWRGTAPETAARLRPVFALAGALAQGSVWLGALWLASAAHPALGGLRDMGADALARSLRMPLLTAGERSYTLADLIFLPLLLGALWLACSLSVRLVRARVFVPAGLDASLQEALALLLRYALLLPAALVLLQVWGIDLRALAILASVFGLGIGFGLQNIANNFVSGLLLNLERPIRPGDYVAVGGSAGTVERIGARSTLIRTVDQIAILVPNSRLLENEVINWSHGDPLSRVHVPVGVAYGSNPALVRRVLLGAAHEHPSVLREPRPRVELSRFGDSSLDFELLVWTRDPRSQRMLVSDLNYRIHDALREAGIAIPFPQHDVQLRAPQLERWLAGWAGRSEPEFPGDSARDPAPGPVELPRAGDRPPAEWSGAEVEALVERMRAPGGVPIRERRHRLRSYADAFVGSEAVDWLVINEGLARGDAVELGQRLVSDGIAHHVLDEHDFRDGHFFYRFRCDERSSAPAA